MCMDIGFLVCKRLLVCCINLLRHIDSLVCYSPRVFSSSSKTQWSDFRLVLEKRCGCKVMWICSEYALITVFVEQIFQFTAFVPESCIVDLGYISQLVSALGLLF